MGMPPSHSDGAEYLGCCTGAVAPVLWCCCCHALCQVQQRDNEIALLINMLKGRSGTTAGSSNANTSTGTAGVNKEHHAGVEAADTSATSDAGVRPGDSSSSAAGCEAPVLSALLDASLLSDRHKAFEVFRQSYRQGQVRRSRWGAKAVT